LFGIHRLIDHTGNLHISAKRQPADAVFTVALFKAEKLNVPGVEEKVKLFYFDAEGSRG